MPDGDVQKIGEGKDFTEGKTVEGLLPPVRMSNLGESRVLHPYPLRRLSIVNMGETNVQYIKQCYLEGYAEKNYGEVWAANAAGYAFHCHKVWSIHDKTTMGQIWKEYEDKQKNIDNVNVDWMKDMKVPVILAEALEEVPNSLEFPLHEVYAEFKNPYFNNTTAFMISFFLLCVNEARKLDPTPWKAELNLYGTDFNYFGVDSVSENGRNCVEYWLGRAEERGVNIFCPPQSMLMDMNIRRAQGLYGYYRQPIAAKDDQGEIIGVAEFVDPLEYRLDTRVCQELEKLVEAKKLPMQLSEIEKVKRNQLIIMGKMIANAMGISMIELLGVLTGKLHVAPKDGQPAQMIF